jgi:cyclic beta-1,2-glucan synthetase
VLYLRDEESGDVWSATPAPASEDLPWRVHHGAGYTDYFHNRRGLVARTRVFMAGEEPVKIVRVQLENTWPHRRRLTLTYYVEWVLGNSREQTAPHVFTEYDSASDVLLARCAWDPELAQRVAFLASSRPTHGFTTDRREFLGENGLARPAALERWGLAGTVQAGVDPCGVLMVHVELAPNERCEISFALGQGDDREHALSLARRFREPEQIDAAWQATRSRWEQLLGAVEVQTPDPSMNLLLNRWLAYEALAARYLGRTGFYQSSGAFGFRDQLQDVLLSLHCAPQWTREHIVRAAAHQFAAGDVLHWWHETKTGAGKGVRTHMSDDMLWLPYVTACYVLATGDRSVLEEQVPFVRGEPLLPDEHERYAHYEHESEPHSVAEHCRRALERGLTHGEHGLPLMGTGDWNDGMNRVGAGGKGESVWLAWFVCGVLAQWSEMLESLDDTERAAGWRRRARALAQSTEAAAWDGQWYLRAWFDDGTPLGSAKSPEARIDLIAQAWATLSGAAQAERSRVALDSAQRELVRDEDQLVLLLAPPFEGVGNDPGYIRGYPPGVRENGGQYTHAAAWLGMAWAQQGEGERAFDVFRMLDPILRTQTAESAAHYRVEPYVVAGDVAGVDPFRGRGGWSWYTGSAAWVWRLGVEGILGLKRSAGGLRIDPCLPAAWTGFSATVRTANCVCRIDVHKPAGVQSGVREILLDGEVLETGRVPLESLTGDHEIIVHMGPAPVVRRPLSQERL